MDLLAHRQVKRGHVDENDRVATLPPSHGGSAPYLNSPAGPLLTLTGPARRPPSQQMRSLYSRQRTGTISSSTTTVLSENSLVTRCPAAAALEPKRQHLTRYPWEPNLAARASPVAARGGGTIPALDDHHDSRCGNGRSNLIRQGPGANGMHVPSWQLASSLSPGSHSP